MAELADALVLGSSVHDVQVQVLLAAPKEMTEVYPLRGDVPRSFLFFGCLCRYHTVLVGADGVCIDGVALGGVGQDAEGVAGVQDAAGLLGTPAHLIDVGLLNDLHVGDFIGKVAPVGLQMNDGTELTSSQGPRSTCPYARR